MIAATHRPSAISMLYNIATRNDSSLTKDNKRTYNNSVIMDNLTGCYRKKPISDRSKELFLLLFFCFFHKSILLF